MSDFDTPARAATSPIVGVFTALTPSRGSVSLATVWERSHCRAMKGTHPTGEGHVVTATTPRDYSLIGRDSQRAQEQGLVAADGTTRRFRASG